MAVFTFDGSASRTITDFDAEDDQLFVSGIDVEEVVSFQEINGSVTLVTAGGAVLTLEGVTFDDLNEFPGSFQSQDSDIDFAIGDSDDDAALAGNVVVAQEGDDSPITVTTEDALVYGNQGDDSIDGGDFNDLRIFGGQGTDTIDGVAAGSTVFGGLNEAFGAGVDFITATGEAGEDDEGVTIFGGNESSDAGDGADVINDSLGNDSILGNGGEDSIGLSGGEDFVHGGANDDAIVFGVTLGAAGGIAGPVVVGDSSSGSTVFGGLGDDTIDASLAEVDAGGEGLNLFGGNGQADVADGNDSIVGSAGDDAIFGNAGNDTLILSGGGVADGGEDTVQGGLGTDSIEGTVSGDAQIFGGLGTDLIDVEVGGDSDGAQIFGGNGQSDSADEEDLIDISGSTADVSVFGNAGDDTIIGGEGDDSLYGGIGGDDIIVQNTGTDDNDLLVGGVGADTYVFEAGASDTDALGDDDNVDAIGGLNFDEDLLDLGAEVDFVQFADADADDLADVEGEAATGADTATIITVTDGDLAGDVYLAFNGTLIEITGYTGTADADDFVTGVA